MILYLEYSCMSCHIKMTHMLKKADNQMRFDHSLSKSGYFYFGHSRTHFWSQGPKILAVASVLANLKNIKRVFENFDFWPLFDRFFMSRVSRGRQVTFDKLPVGAKPWPQKIFKKFLSFFGSKKIKVTVKPIYKKLFFLYEKSIRKKGGQICSPPRKG